MDQERVKELVAEVKKRVHVHCDEYHAHSARRGCIDGDEQDVLICVLMEYLQELKGRCIEHSAKIDPVLDCVPDW